MAVKYISELTSVSTINDNDVLVIDDGNHNYKIPWAAVKALLGTVSSMEAMDTGAIKLTLANGTILTALPHDPTKQNTLIFDNTPTENSNNPVKSGGVFTALGTKLNTSDYVVFQGATQSAAGVAGKVPAPAGLNMYLGSAGAWETPDSEPTEGSQKLIMSGAVKEAIDNVEIDVDTALSDSSTNPVQNKVVNAEFDKVKMGTAAQKAYHLGLYLDSNGDLCYD